MSVLSNLPMTERNKAAFINVFLNRASYQRQLQFRLHTASVLDIKTNAFFGNHKILLT